jgi:hypothetical protein
MVFIIPFLDLPHPTETSGSEQVCRVGALELLELLPLIASKNLGGKCITMGTGICKADGHSHERTSTTVSQTFILPRFEQETKFAVSCGFLVSTAPSLFCP